MWLIRAGAGCWSGVTVSQAWRVFPGIQVDASLLLLDPVQPGGLPSVVRPAVCLLDGVFSCLAGFSESSAAAPGGWRTRPHQLSEEFSLAAACFTLRHSRVSLLEL